MGSQKAQYAIAIVVVLAVAAVAVWYVFLEGGVPAPQPAAAPASPASVPEAPAAAAATSSLGASILEKAQNPVQGKVPELSPTANPVKDVYKNPFE
jgi:hypothetical protein